MNGTILGSGVQLPSGMQILDSEAALIIPAVIFQGGNISQAVCYREV